MRNRTIPNLSEADKAYVRGLVLYEDEAVLAFNKPAGLPSQTRGNRGRNLDHVLWAFARSNGKRPRLVHRLDAGTSGLILAGKTKPAATALSTAFETRQVQKTYLALCAGDIELGQTGQCSDPLRRADRRVIVASDGDAAQTDWTCLAVSDKGVSLIEARPYTGRMHQIRAHLSHAGLPLLGDAIYGDGGSAPRLMLHAARLELPHPRPHPSGEALSLSAPLPDDFNLVLSQYQLQPPPLGKE